jgi:hypothetical protein
LPVLPVLPVVLALLLALLAALVALVALPAALAAVAVLVSPLEAALEVLLLLLLLPSAFALPEPVFASPLLLLVVFALVLAPPLVTVNLLQSSWAPRCATYDVVVSKRRN